MNGLICVEEGVGCFEDEDSPDDKPPSLPLTGVDAGGEAPNRLPDELGVGFDPKPPSLVGVPLELDAGFEGAESVEPKGRLLDELPDEPDPAEDGGEPPNRLPDELGVGFDPKPPSLPSVPLELGVGFEDEESIDPKGRLLDELPDELGVGFENKSPSLVGVPLELGVGFEGDESIDPKGRLLDELPDELDSVEDGGEPIFNRRLMSPLSFAKFCRVIPADMSKC